MQVKQFGDNYLFHKKEIINMFMTKLPRISVITTCFQSPVNHKERDYSNTPDSGHRGEKLII